MVLEQVMHRTVSRFAQDVASVRAQSGALGSILGPLSPPESSPEVLRGGTVAVRE
jgi:hypothetical protein